MTVEPLDRGAAAAGPGRTPGADQGAALPRRALALIARAAAADGLHGAVPQVLRHLSDGYTNANHLVQVGGRLYVVRTGNADAARLGIDRAREETIWRHAAARGLSPALLAFDAALGDAVSAYVDAPSLADRLARGEAPDLPRLAALLRRTHALEVEAPQVDARATVRRYLALADAVGAVWPAWTQPLLARCEAAPAPATVVLTHHDFSPWNLLLADRPADGRADPLADQSSEQGADLVLDWEYAALGDPMFDVATLATHLGLDGAGLAALLDAYGAGAAARARLPLLELLFHLREFTWAGAMRALGLGSPSVDAQYARESAWLAERA